MLNYFRVLVRPLIRRVRCAASAELLQSDQPITISISGAHFEGDFIDGPLNERPSIAVDRMEAALIWGHPTAASRPAETFGREGTPFGLLPAWSSKAALIKLLY